MNILQWNLTSMNTNFNELKILIQENNPTCICLQETRHGDKILKPPSGYKITQSPKKRDDDHERGVAVLIRNNINYKIITLNTNLQAVATRIWMGKWYTVCSIYLPHIDVEKNDILNLLQQLPEPFLLLGDMNARHHLWGEEIDNQKGKFFEELLIEEDLILLNNNEPTHYHIQTNSYTTIDLSIVSSDCYLDFNYKILSSLHGSDHYPISIDKIIAQEAGEPSNRFKTEKADWAKFNRLTNNFIQADLNNINEETDQLTSFIIQAARNSIPMSNRRSNKTPVPWWNTDCTNCLKERKRAEKACRRNPTIANKIAYKRLKAVCRKTFKQAKTESWIAYVSSINANTSMEKIWKRVQKIKGKFTRRPPPLLNNAYGIETQNPNETSNIFGEAFASISATENYTQNFQRYKRTQERKHINFTSNNEEPYNTPFSVEELNHALATTNETAPGYDQITYSMIKNSHITLQTAILNLYNKIFINETFPITWTVATIIPIPKPGKDPSRPLNYRPISLTSCLCKLVEKMINLRLMWYLEKMSAITNYQSGFRKNRSTTDCLAQLEIDIETAMSRKEHTIAIFFDLAKAYDMTWKHGILKKLHESQLRGHLPAFIRNFLSNRKIRVKVENTHSEEHHLAEGVPQGSVLSCTCFALGIDGCLTNLPHGVKAALYVDDLVIYYSGSNTSTIERRLQMAIKKLEKWCDETGYKFSPAKTVAMHICRKRECPKTAHQLTLYNEAITCKEEHRYLGLIVDNSLRWNTHVKQLKIECNSRMNLLKHLSHTTWGADMKTLKMLYQALIKSKLEYGNEIYESTSKTNSNSLIPIRNKALRVATGAFRSSPIDSLEIISGSLPIQYTRETKLINYIMRIKINELNPINDILPYIPHFEEADQIGHNHHKRSFLVRSQEAVTNCNIDTSYIMKENEYDDPPWITGRISICNEMTQYIKKEVPTNILRNIYQNHIQQHNANTYKLYTDGSKTEQGVAFAVYSEDFSTSKRVSNSTSIFTAELYGILEAINYSANVAEENILIATDSKSSIQAIRKLYPRNPIVQKIQKAIRNNNKIFTLCWVPSHIGIHGNESADRLAVQATAWPLSTQFQQTRSDLKAYIRKTYKEKWKEKWRQERPNKLLEITDNIYMLPNTVCENRQWERCLTRLRIGHSKLTHGHYMSREQPPICEDCGEDTPLTIKHILTECPSLNNRRRQFFGTTNKTMKQLLNDGDTTYGGTLYKFVTNIDLLTKL